MVEGYCIISWGDNMSNKEIFICSTCKQEYIRSANSKAQQNKCDNCILSEAWENLIVAMAESLRLDIFLRWLIQKLSKTKRPG